MIPIGTMVLCTLQLTRVSLPSSSEKIHVQHFFRVTQHDRYAVLLEARRENPLKDENSDISGKVASGRRP